LCGSHCSNLDICYARMGLAVLPGHIVPVHWHTSCHGKGAKEARTAVPIAASGWSREQRAASGLRVGGRERQVTVCWNTCAGNLFEEVEPAAILEDRKNENGTRDFLVKWSDGTEDSWVCSLRKIDIVHFLLYAIA
jgi:hypothetical protein